MMFFRIKKSIKATGTADQIPFQRIRKGAKQKMLILGDSTMYGTGITDRNNTIGGLLAAKFPSANIETKAFNGARVRDIPAQLNTAEFPLYDLIITGVGGNDVVKFSDYHQLEKDLNELLGALSQRAERIILCHTVNVGNIGYFPFPLSRIYDYRSRRLSQIYTRVSGQFPKVRYVNFYRAPRDDFYTKSTRAKFIASDSYHPSDYANRFFFNLIWKDVDKSKTPVK